MRCFRLELSLYMMSQMAAPTNMTITAYQIGGALSSGEAYVKDPESARSITTNFPSAPNSLEVGGKTATWSEDVL
ncbi:hypothetical protein GCM10025859_36950 [Alicyclobacillus fastidiosus]|nr:hypothetical protein GCM10025859_36950 [Alicyclobacillus fastidiosus]